MTKDSSNNPFRLVLVTGPSGAGRSTAIHALEDLGFEAIDNLPLRLVPLLLDGPTPPRPLALGMDPRNREFSAEGLLELIETLSSRADTELTVLYLDCRDEVLLRRFSETRRRHPLAPAESPETGIRRELGLLAPLRERADTLIDTSDMNVHQLREEIERWFAPDTGRALALTVHSFSYKRGLPRGIDMVFDCRFLSNPYWVPALRALDGRDPAVAAHVAADPLFAPFFDRVLDLTRFLLPAYTQEGKAHLSIAFGCTGGQHRSVMLAETLVKALAEDGQQVSIRHRELDSQRNG
ncbi:RNase adapter RapZ [Pseudodonghicola xiamenensis]|uniref:Nucleotide-binding protein n=1 Tax=Pseudodonghicola xiamenensis TaxID=337702 RepID=A0A8J3HC09_9RHOB|nr:RNase adapter RapZ [Pseudodonghicola xiamenensis]GHH00618.1 nucleotide-binding protein [Pseudodonghicola xiamenensis]